MKYFLLFALSLAAFPLQAQKYVLLDMRMVKPVTYSNKITTADKFNELFPVEKGSVKVFVNALEEITKELSAANGHMRKAIPYHIGCITFAGTVLPLATGDRLDYVIHSTCDGVKISMHLSDAKLKNTSNAYFIKTWIKYIKTAAK
ncbi:MAG: hypothetical protein ABIR03_12485 [Ginsengibacter sp.]